MDEALPGGDVGEIADPQHIRPRSPELPVHLVPWTRRGGIADRRFHRLAADHTRKSHLFHQPRRRAPGKIDPLSVELSPDLAHTIDLEILIPHPADLGPQLDVPFGARRQAARVGTASGMRTVGRRRDRQNLADRLDTVDFAMRVDERDHGLYRRSSSA